MRRINRKRPIDYILPFLVILGLGVIGILGYQLWQNFEKQGKADVYFYVAEGKAKILPYGQTAWDSAFSGTKLLLGDSIKTTSLGKVVTVFFNGTIIRLGSDTAVTLTDLTKGTDLEKIVLTMDNGSIWVNGHKSPGVREANYEIRTTHLRVKAKGTVFEVESNASEIVRVLDGQVAVDVLVGAAGSERVANTIEVGVGQEIVLDEATLKAFEDNQSPSVLLAIGEQFKSGPWYLWNMEEDKNPTSYSPESTQVVATETAGGTQVVGTPGLSQETSESVLPPGSTMQTEESGTQQDTNPLEAEFSGSNGAPEITSPAADARTVEKGPVAISGNVPEGTQKVIVERIVEGKTDSYTLGKFRAGDTTFSYNVSEKLGNLESGDNTYYFYATDEKGNKSDAAEITITNEKQAVEISGSLAAPVVLSFNGSSSPIVTTDVVKIDGSISGAEKVVVNDFVLTKFEPGASTWSYSAKEALGNLKPGVNEYQVYGIDQEGNKSEVVKFTITYNKEEGTQETAVVQPGTTTPETLAQPGQPASPVYGF